MLDLSQIRIEKNSLMLITAVVYIIGISVGFAGNYYVPSIIMTVIFAVCAKMELTKLKYLLAWILIFYLGIFFAVFRVSDTDKLFSLAPQEGYIVGKIVSIPNGDDGKSSKFFMKVSTFENGEKTFDKINSKVLVSLRGDVKPNNSEALKLSDTYRIKGSLRRPFRPSNPSQFDYGKYLKNFDAHTVFYANIDDAENLPTTLSFVDKIIQNINELRREIIKTHAITLKSPNLELLGGIVFGDDAVAPPDYIKMSFINSGLLHILAASGMNVAFVYGFWFIIAGLFKIPYKARIVLGIPLILLYALMAGLGASVVRAAIMIIFVLVGKLIDRDSNSISLLAFVAFLMLLVKPSYVNDVGFQLSFVVTFGILLMSPLVITFGEGERPLSLKNKVLNSVMGTVCIPIIAQIWVMPIQMFHFNTISLYSVFANILTVPFLAIVSFCGFVGSIIAPLGIVGEGVCKILDTVLNPLLSSIVAISNTFALFPNSLITTIHPNLVQVLLYYSLVILVTMCLIKKIFCKKFIFWFGVLLVFLFVSFIRIGNNGLEVIFFDVQNADCALLKTPSGRYFMIDTGKAGYAGGKSQAEFIVTKYLKDKGIKKLDFIIVTHFDNDHSGGTVDLMKFGKPDRVYLNSNSVDSQTSYQIFEYLNANPQIKINYAKNNEVIYEEPCLRVTNYFADFDTKDFDNENSIITLIECYGKTILFTGDAGIMAMTKLKKDLPNGIDVLKVPHHGASGVLNAELVNKFLPKVSLISVGKNVYGHPARETLELLENREVLRTDINNAIKLEVSSESLIVKNYDMKKKKFVKFCKKI